jgi:hypothetical protein
MEDNIMSILNNMLKVCGTIVEGCGKTLVDCVEVIEQERKEYKASEQYVKDMEEREIMKQEIKENWAQIKKNINEARSSYNNYKSRVGK